MCTNRNRYPISHIQYGTVSIRGSLHPTPPHPTPCGARLMGPGEEGMGLGGVGSLG